MASRDGSEPYDWRLSHAVVLTEAADVTVFVDTGLTEIFVAGRALTAFVPGASTVEERGHELE